MSLDAYTLRARVLPAVIVALPVLMLGSFAVATPIAGIVPAIGGVALAYGSAEWVRHRGLATEVRLKASWGDFPTTRALRATGHSATGHLLALRRALEAVTGDSLPTSLDQQKDGDAADAEIERIVRIGIARVRETKIEATVLQAENISYGFRRNTRGLKPIGATTTALSVILTVLFASFSWSVVPLVIAVDLLLGIFWFGVVNDTWVRRQAEKYSERYFVAIEAIATSPRKGARNGN